MPSRTCVTVVPVTTAVQHRGQRLRTEPQQPRLVLVDVDPDHPRRLHPVEIDVPRVRSRSTRSARAATRCRAPRSMSGPLTRYWTGQPTGGPSPSGDTRRHGARELRRPAPPPAVFCSRLRAPPRPWQRQPPGRRRRSAVQHSAADRSGSRRGRHRCSSGDIGVAFQQRRPAVAAASRVAKIEAFCGRCRSTSSSGRSDGGKNCRGISGDSQRRPRRNSRRVMPMVIQRARIAPTSNAAEHAEDPARLTGCRLSAFVEQHRRRAAARTARRRTRTRSAQRRPRRKSKRCIRPPNSWRSRSARSRRR